MNQSELSRCAREQSTIGEQIRAGDGQFGLRLGAQDWLREEAILRKDGTRTPDSGAGGEATLSGRGTMEQK